MAEACANCGQTLHGEYCQACGQRRFTEADRRLGHLLRQAFHAATDLDGRFWGSLRALAFRPGLLSRDYLEGRRRRWMAPMALFLLANVLYFVLPTGVTDFNLPLENQVRQPVHGALAERLVQARLAADEAGRQARWAALPEDRRAQRPAPVRRAEIAAAYDARAGDVGKALIIVHVPLLALGLWLCFHRRRRYFAEHVVVALHAFTFLLLFFQLVLLPAGWLYAALVGRVGGGGMPPWALAASVLVVALHFGLSLRRAYDAPWWAALLLPLPLLLWMMQASVMVYRPAQFFLTWAIT